MKTLIALLLIPALVFAQQQPVFSSEQLPGLDYIRKQAAQQAYQAEQKATTQYLNEAAAAQRLQNFETGQRLFNPSYNQDSGSAPQFDAAAALQQILIQQQLNRGR